ncbi:MAG: hypothetical protein JNJ95_00790 [Dechloromonas sp.]|nr:hypothetical protein [Dechloromonas sp.]
MMKPKGKMPTPWKHPKTGSYYLNRRVPADVSESFGKIHVLKSLGTKDYREAEKRICKMWLCYQQEFEKLRAQRQTLQPLREDQAEQLALLWYSDLLEEDDRKRIEEGHWEKTLRKSEESLAWCLAPTKEALAKGDVASIADEMDDWLDGLGYSFERDSIAYQRTGMAFLRRFVKYLEAVRLRNQGEVTIGLITGHTRQAAGISRVQQGYVSKRTVEKLNGIVCKIDFGLKLPVPKSFTEKISGPNP